MAALAHRHAQRAPNAEPAPVLVQRLLLKGLHHERLLVGVALKELGPRAEAVTELSLSLCAPRCVGEIACVDALLLEVDLEPEGGVYERDL